MENPLSIDLTGIRALTPSDWLDQLRPEEAATNLPLEQFWDQINARPRMRTPRVGGLLAASTFPQRDQKWRHNCVCFAILAAMELRAWRNGRVLDLSEQFASYLLMEGRGGSPNDDEAIRLADALAILKDKAVCLEDDCQYGDPGDVPSQKAWQSARYSFSDYFLINRLTPIAPIPPMTPVLDGPGISNTSYVENILTQGYDVIVALCLTRTLDFDRATSVGIVHSLAGPHYCVPTFPNYSHAIVLTGFVRLATTPYFICRNSVPAMSEHVPLLLSYDYVRAYAEYGAVITGISTVACE